MSEAHEEYDARPQPPEHLRPLSSVTDRIKGLLTIGLLLFASTGVLTFVAPNALWFLLYPVLILGALAALATAAAWLLRHLE